jgi:LysR family transcriptional regulator for bpeEF and oprC
MIGAAVSVFTGVEAFVAVAEGLSFRAGAARLGVSPAAVSKAVGKLEERLGVRLLDRTSRSVKLTREGTVYLRRCREAVDAMAVGLAELGTVHSAVAGTLTVTAPSILGRPLLRHLPRLVGPHPQLQLDLRWSDRFTRLLEEDIDIAVRIGQLDDSGLVAHRLATLRWATVASPVYLARRPPIKHPTDLARDHVLLGYRGTTGKVVEWSFSQSRDQAGAPLELAYRHTFDQGDLLLHAAELGLGVVQVFSFQVKSLVEAGQLVEVLPDHAARGPIVHALCRPHQARTPRIRAFFEWSDGLRLR